MAKISTKTFNPMAGVSLPGWALQSYKATAGDLSDVVDSLTDAYNKQQDREAALGLEAFQMNQEQSNFEAQMEYKNENDVKNRALATEKEDNLNRYRRDTLRANELNEENDTYWKEYDASKSILDNSISNFTIGEFDEKLAVLNSYNTRGNSQVRQLKESYIKSAEQDKFKVMDRAVQIGNMLPRYMDTSFESLSKADQEYLVATSKESLNPSNAAVFRQLMSNSWFPYENIDPITQGRIDRWVTQGNLIVDDPTRLENWQLEGISLQEEIAPKVEADEDYYLSMTDDERAGQTLYGGISYSGLEVHTDPETILVDEAGNASYLVQFEDGTSERVAGSAIEGQFPADFNKPALLAGMKLKKAGWKSKADDKDIDEASWYDDLAEWTGVPTLGRYLSREDSPTGTLSRYLSREDTDLSEQAGALAAEFVKSPAEAYDITKEAASEVFTITPDEYESWIEAGKSIEDITGAVKSAFKETYPIVDAVLAQAPRIVGAKPTAEQDKIFASAVNEIAGDMKTVSMFAMSQLPRSFQKWSGKESVSPRLAFQKLDKAETPAPSYETNLAGRAMSKEVKKEYSDYVKEGGRKKIAQEVQKQITSLKKVRSKISATPNYENKKEMISKIDELINRANRVQASKSAKELFDVFNIGAEFDFDYEKEVDTKVDQALKEIESEDSFEQILEFYKPKGGQGHRWDFETYHTDFPLYK